MNTFWIVFQWQTRASSDHLCCLMISESGLIEEFVPYILQRGEQNRTIITQLFLFHIPKDQKKNISSFCQRKKWMSLVLCEKTITSYPPGESDSIDRDSCGSLKTSIVSCSGIKRLTALTFSKLPSVQNCVLIQTKEIKSSFTAMFQSECCECKRYFSSRCHIQVLYKVVNIHCFNLS
jgi:hypothetical protein